MTSKEVKLRKLHRVKQRKYRTGKRLTHYISLYYNYFFQVFGKHEHLWDIINEGIVWK
jgi:hypothetical protein